MERFATLHQSSSSSPWCITYLMVCGFMQVFWPKVVLKKLLNITGDDADFSADEGDNGSEFEEDGCFNISSLW